MKNWWIALPAIFIMTAFTALARPDVATAGPNTQDLHYVYSASSQTLTLWTESFDPALTPQISVQSLKVDGAIFSASPGCTLINNGVVRQCVFSGVVALQRIAAAVQLSDIGPPGSPTLEGKTRIHCHNVATNGCDGVKTVDMR